MWEFPSEGRDVSWVDMGWRLEHVTTGTTASSTKCKGSSQLAVRSTQGEEVEVCQKIGCESFSSVERVDHVDP